MNLLREHPRMMPECYLLVTYSAHCSENSRSGSLCGLLVSVLKYELFVLFNLHLIWYKNAWGWTQLSFLINESLLVPTWGWHDSSGFTTEFMSSIHQQEQQIGCTGKCKVYLKQNLTKPAPDSAFLGKAFIISIFWIHKMMWMLFSNVLLTHLLVNLKRLECKQTADDSNNFVLQSSYTLASIASEKESDFGRDTAGNLQWWPWWKAWLDANNCC